LYLLIKISTNKQTKQLLKELKTMKVQIKLIKSNAKTNITCSTSHYPDGEFRSFNFTGKLISCEGFVSREGINYDNELVEIDCGTTVIINNQAQGEAIYEKAGAIFAQRAAKGDKNPALDLLIECNSINPTNTNILVSKVNKVYVESNTTLASSKENIEGTLNNLRRFSNARTTISTTPQRTVNNQLSSARKGLNNILSSVKSYL
jgi:hypothetical protein